MPKTTPPGQGEGGFYPKAEVLPLLALLLLFYANAAKMSRLSAVEILDVEGKLMGQAMRKLDFIYSGSSKLEGSEVPKYSSKPSNNNNLNNNDYDYDIYILERKRNDLKTYLDRNIGRKHILRSSGSSISEVKKFQNGSEVVDNVKTITVTEAHNILGKSTKTIYKWCENGKLQARKVSGTTADYWQISYDSVMEVKNSLEVKKLQTIEEVPEIDVPEVPIIDNSASAEITHTEIYQPENNFVTREELNAYTSAIKDFTIALSDIRQENRHELDKQREYFEKLLAQQQELSVSMLEELKREKDAEKKEVLTAIENVKNDSYSNAENILKEYEWIKKQNEDILAAQSKRPWWKFWKK